MGLVDIVVIVLVVVIVVTRFTKFKLPKDLRDKPARRADFDKLRGRPLVNDDKPEMRAEPVDVTAHAEVVRTPKKPSFKEMQAAAKHLTGMAKIKALEPGFDEVAFVDGAKTAYAYFYTCWNAKDEHGLEDLCAPALYARLMTELHDASWQPVLVDEITQAEIGEAKAHGKTAVIEVKFKALEREGSGVARVVARDWVLARPLGSEDPNWELQDIRVKADS